MTTVSILGLGRVGGALALSLPPAKYTLETLVCRKPTPEIERLAQQLTGSPIISCLQDLDHISSEIIFITTQDACIGQAAEDIAEIVTPSATVFHTSGALDSSILAVLGALGCRTGSLHPLVSISRAEYGPERFRGAYFCVEGDDEAVLTGKAIVTDLGARPFSIDTRFKTLYHASAVTACGHLVALFDAAIEMMTKCGLTEDRCKDILLPLVLSTVHNLEEQDTALALTGTFARADIETFTRHLTALNENVSDELLEIYLLLGERSLELAAKRGVSEDRIDRLRAKVSIAKSKLTW